MLVTGETVAAFLGQGQDLPVVLLAEEHLPLVTAFVRAYTGGRGFDVVTGEPTEDVAAVIVTTTARLVTNPTLLERETVGTYTAAAGVLNGFSLPELAVLHRYRRRAA